MMPRHDRIGQSASKSEHKIDFYAAFLAAESQIILGQKTEETKQWANKPKKDDGDHDNRKP